MIKAPLLPEGLSQMNGLSDDDNDYVYESLKHLDYFVLADTFARTTLMERHALALDSRMFNVSIGGTSNTQITFYPVYVKERPDKVFCFYEASGQIVHWREVEAFIDELRGPREKCDAIGFHRCVAWYSKL
jgi:hypothetical protein